MYRVVERRTIITFERLFFHYYEQRNEYLP